MTSGVKLGPPPMRIAAASLESKGARTRPVGLDFAEALAASTDERHPARAKPAGQDSEIRPDWLRIASRLDRTEIDEREALLAERDQEDEAPADTRIATIQTDKSPQPTRPRSRPAPPAAASIPDTSPVQASTIELNETTNEESAAPPHASLPAPAASVSSDLFSDQRTSKDMALRPAPVFLSEKSLTGKADRETDTEKTEILPPRVGERQTGPAFVSMGRGRIDEPGFDSMSARDARSPAQLPVDKTASDVSPDSSVPHPLPRSAEATPRVTIISQQTVPSPASSTALVLVESIATSDLVDAGGPKLSIDRIHASTMPVAVQSLKIQLHPAELGMVTATLRFADERLSIELKVENQEAYRRLSFDSDLIVNSLRDLGYDVDRVTVLRPASAATGSARAEGSASMNMPHGRAAEQFGQGSGNGGNAGSGSRPQGGGENSGRGGQQNHAPRQDPAGGIYI